MTGGTVNQTGSILIRSRTRRERDRCSRRSSRWSPRPSGSRAPIQGLADKVAGWFVPVVILIAIITFISWAASGPEPRLGLRSIKRGRGSDHRAVHVPLACATPMSIMVGVGRGAQAGVLIKKAEAIELDGKVRTLVVDKTGTLTEGKPAVTECRA